MPGCETRIIPHSWPIIRRFVNSMHGPAPHHGPSTSRSPTADPAGARARARAGPPWTNVFFSQRRHRLEANASLSPPPHIGTCRFLGARSARHETVVITAAFEDSITEANGPLFRAAEVGGRHASCTLNAMGLQLRGSRSRSRLSSPRHAVETLPRWVL